MSTNSPHEFDATQAAVSVADQLAAPTLDPRQIERNEMALYGLSGIVEDLAIHLYAECASRGIDWFDVLAAATRRCLWPGQRH